MALLMNKPVGWLVCLLAPAALSGCITGTSVLAERCAASDDGVPTQEEIDACAALESNPRLDHDTVVAARLRQAMAYYELGDYEQSMAVYDEISFTPYTPAAVWYGRAQTQAALGSAVIARRDAEHGMDHDPAVVVMLHDLYERGELDELINKNGFFKQYFEPSIPWVPELMVSLMLGSYESDVPLNIRVRLRQRALAFTGHYDGPVNGRVSAETDAAIDACIADACWERFGTTM